jgi:quercetin dioxygenase-like cupin family protein
MNASFDEHTHFSRRRAVAYLGTGGLGLALATQFRSVVAQEATPGAETGSLPPGVSLVELPQITPFALPEEPGAVRVFWLLLEPNAAIPTHPHPFSEFAVMESGTAMFLTAEGPAAQAIRGGEAGPEASPEVGDPGVELTATAGDVAIFPSGNVSDTRAGEKGATMLILEIVTAADEATPAG